MKVKQNNLQDDENGYDSHVIFLWENKKYWNDGILKYIVAAYH